MTGHTTLHLAQVLLPEGFAENVTLTLDHGVIMSVAAGAGGTGRSNAARRARASRPAKPA